MDALSRGLRKVLGRRKIDRRDDLLAFWRQPAPDGNVPQGYIDPVHRSQALAKLIADVPFSGRILEVGCNVGRNLAYLHDQGWHGVEGVEISPHAVELLRTTYPQLAARPIHLGAAEDVLPTLESGAYDLVFTMAVLEHIHPDSRSVFDDMARVGRSILSIEPVGHASHRQFPHDVRGLFAERGFHLVSEQAMETMPETASDPSLRGYYAWRFAK